MSKNEDYQAESTDTAEAPSWKIIAATLPQISLLASKITLFELNQFLNKIIIATNVE